MDQPHNAADAAGLARIRPLTDPAFAFRALEDARQSPDPDYVDCHGGVFTPGSFALLIHDLGELGLLDWHIESCAGGTHVEFIVHLRRGHRRRTLAEAQARRQELLIQTLLELQDQAAIAARATPAPQPPDVTAPAGALLTACAQRFILLVHSGAYAEAEILAPCFADLDRTCAALAGSPSDLLHTIYCLGILALLGRQDSKAATAAFAQLREQASLIHQNPATAVLGAEFLALAEPHLRTNARAAIP
jgi:hypothetical protein